jgi:hypothetical protein
MRTKTLLLTAALTAAGLASSMAQVYSVNAVGYVNAPIPGANQLAILANPLKGTNNSVSTVIPTAPDGFTIYRFDAAVQNYRDAITYFDGIGWLSTDPDPQLPVGEGFWMQNPAAATTLTFVGEVAQGADSNGIQLQGGNRLSLVASAVPQSARLGTPAAPGTLAFPAADGDTVYQFDTTIQNYKDAYTYFDGIGWLHSTDTNPDGPLVNVATGFWLQRSAAAGVWNRNFSVN